jgi:hypothetical protein
MGLTTQEHYCDSEDSLWKGVPGPTSAIPGVLQKSSPPAIVRACRTRNEMLNRAAPTLTTLHHLPLPLPHVNLRCS